MEIILFIIRIKSKSNWIKLFVTQKKLFEFQGFFQNIHRKLSCLKYIF